MTLLTILFDLPRLHKEVDHHHTSILSKFFGLNSILRYFQSFLSIFIIYLCLSSHNLLYRNIQATIKQPFLDFCSHKWKYQTLHTLFLAKYGSRGDFLPKLQCKSLPVGQIDEYNCSKPVNFQFYMLWDTLLWVLMDHLTFHRAHYTLQQVNVDPYEHFLRVSS